MFYFHKTKLLLAFPLVLALTAANTAAHAAEKSRRPAAESAAPTPDPATAGDAKSVNAKSTDEKPADAKAADAGNAAERVNVETIRQKYWARGEESELGVVQSRLYSKARKFELGVYGGLVFSDPFLSIHSLGLTAGYHFTEYFSLHLLGFRDYVSKSSALNTFEETVAATATIHATTQNNPPRYFLGAEAMGSFLYGKLSLIGKSIIYYDMHLLGGAGLRNTESGTYVAPYVGIGQQVYLNQVMSLRLDYRLMAYNENLIEKVITTRLGQTIGSRVNYTNLLTLGVTFLIGGPAK